MLHEVLVALAGSPGDLIVSQREGRVWTISPDVEFLHPSERHLLVRIARMGWLYARLNRWLRLRRKESREADAQAAKVHSEQGEESVDCMRAPGAGLYGRALANGIEQELDPYRSCIVALEQQALKDPGMPLTKLGFALREWELVLPMLDSIASAADAGGLRGGEILDHLFVAATSGVPVLKMCIERLLFKCHAVMFEQLEGWIAHGLLLDPFEEFFVCKMEGQEDVDGVAVANAWNTKFGLRLGMLPQHVGAEVAEKVLVGGKAVHWLKAATSEDEANRLPEEDAEWLRKELGKCARQSPWHGPSFAAMMDRVHGLLTKHLHHLVVEEASLWLRLKAMRDYYLLGRGDFWESFVADARKVMMLPPSVNANHGRCANIKKLLGLDISLPFQAAAGNSTAEYDEFHVSLLSLHLRPPPHGEASGSTDPWRHLWMDMKVDSPLDLVLGPEALERYNQLFSLLLTVKRVQSELKLCWRPMKASHSIWAAQLRNEMSFLVDNLMFYIQVDVLDVQFHLLEEKIKASTVFDQVLKAHEVFLANVVTHCFLRVRTVTRALESMFQLCRTFCASVLQHGPDGLSKAHVDEMERAFRHQYSFLYTILSGVKQHHSAPHLAQLLLRFNFNGWMTRATRGGV